MTLDIRNLILILMVNSTSQYIYYKYILTTKGVLLADLFYSEKELFPILEN